MVQLFCTKRRHHVKEKKKPQVMTKQFFMFLISILMTFFFFYFFVFNYTRNTNQVIIQQLFSMGLRLHQKEYFSVVNHLYNCYFFTRKFLSTRIHEQHSLYYYIINYNCSNILSQQLLADYRSFHFPESRVDIFVLVAFVFYSAKIFYQR